MKVSILMCAYNAELYIEKAIESIIAQTYTEWELLISNDGSTDSTRSIVEKFLGDSRIRLFNQPRNLGYVQNKNWLFKHAGSELITQLDADDTCDPKRIEKQVKVFSQHPEIMICGTFHYRFDSNDNILPEPATHTYDFLITSIQKDYPFWYSSLMMRRELMDEFGLFSEYFSGIAGDDEYWVFKVNQKYPIYFIKDPLYHYRIHPLSYTNVLDNSRKMITAEILAELYRQRKETGTDWLEQNQPKKMLAFEEKLFRDKKLMSAKYRVWAAKAVDGGSWDEANLLLKESVRFDRLHSMTLRTIFYYIRKLIRHKLLKSKTTGK